LRPEVAIFMVGLSAEEAGGIRGDEIPSGVGEEGFVLWPPGPGRE
jgi:hypothetical protein